MPSGRSPNSKRTNTAPSMQKPPPASIPLIHAVLPDSSHHCKIPHPGGPDARPAHGSSWEASRSPRAPPSYGGEALPLPARAKLTFCVIPSHHHHHHHHHAAPTFRISSGCRSAARTSARMCVANNVTAQLRNLATLQIQLRDSWTWRQFAPNFWVVCGFLRFWVLWDRGLWVSVTGREFSCGVVGSFRGVENRRIGLGSGGLELGLKGCGGGFCEGAKEATGSTMINFSAVESAASNPRRDPFKSSVGKGAGQRRRQAAITVGKDRRESVVRAKRLRRADPSEHGDGDAMQLVTAGIDDEAAYKALEDNTVAAVNNLKNLGKGTAAKKVEALQSIRRLLSSSAYPPVHAAVQAGVVPLLIDYLAFGASEDQLFEAAWCLTNIASGDPEQTRAVEPALPLLILHLGEKNPAKVVEQCAWAIGNVAGEAEDLRDWLLRQGALPALARNLVSPIITLARTAAWALSNLIKGPNPRAAAELMKMDGIVDTLVRLVSTGDDELVVEVTWVLVYVTSMSDVHSSQLIHAGLLPPLVTRLALSRHLALLTPVLRSIGNIVASDNSKCDAVLTAGQSLPGGVIGALARILESEYRTLQKEAAWVVSNLAAGSILHKRAVFNEGTVPPLLHLLATSAFDVRKEAAYALGNLCVTPRDQGAEGKPILEHLTVLVDRGCLMGFIALVKSPDLEAARLGLQFLELVMRALPDGKGPKLVEKEDGIAAMEELQFHDNEELRIMSNSLVDKYFGEDYGLEEEFGSSAMSTQDDSEYPPWRRGGLTA